MFPSTYLYDTNLLILVDDDDEIQSSDLTEDCTAEYSSIVKNSDLKKSHFFMEKLFNALIGCHKEFLSNHDKKCLNAIKLSISHCEESSIKMTLDKMGQNPQTKKIISSIQKMSRLLVSNLRSTQNQSDQSKNQSRHQSKNQSKHSAYKRYNKNKGVLRQ